MKKRNGVWLLQQFCAITLQFDEKQNGFVSTMAAQRGFLACPQHVRQSPASYRDNLRSWAVTLSQQGGSIAANYRLIPATDSDGNLCTKVINAPRHMT